MEWSGGGGGGEGEGMERGQITSWVDHVTESMLSLDTRRGCYTNSGLTHATSVRKNHNCPMFSLQLQMELTHELTHPKCAGWPRQKI